ncbi:hypothetical protein BSL78_02522 [Apostichopus japonicus]|uniref:Glycosyl transferase GT2 family n=1 Tax=Stichopus japonicus TaxID=307972 RepID=A0A2G8LJZ9_STIJA|nr:hypothetical protein BSL78_02522 [Apostichopus japonicus]
MIEKDDCKKLLDYFEVPAKEAKDITESDAPFLSVINHLREAGKVSVDDISHLMTACSDKGLSKLVAVLTVYQQAQDSKLTKKVLKYQLKALTDKRQELSHKLTESEDEKQQLTVRLKTTEEESQQFKDALKATEEERQQLNGRLKTIEEERQQFRDRLETTEEEREHFRIRLSTTENKLKTLKDGKDELLQQQKEELEEAKASLKATKDELVKSQLEHAKESMALLEVLKLPREALKQASSASVTEEETLLEEHETPDISQQPILAADYGRLMVNVADNLTLDSTLKLATLFGLPPAETDMLRRVSLIETPGITLINFMKTRNIINLYDVTNLQKGEITWTEEKSFDWKLDPEKISLDINILSYVFVNLVSKETEQKHIFRIVPFIDGILDAKDDVLITVCFCKDSEEEYKLLLEDHQSKLSLGNHKTFQVTRTLHDSRDSASYIDLMMSSPGDSYHLMKEESTKHVDIDHLCAASRVSHQFRLNRNNDEDTDMVDVKLKVSQHEENQVVLILQSKGVIDRLLYCEIILLSPESQDILFRELHPGEILSGSGTDE